MEQRRPFSECVIALGPDELFKRHGIKPQRVYLPYRIGLARMMDDTQQRPGGNNMHLGYILAEILQRSYAMWSLLYLVEE